MATITNSLYQEQNLYKEYGDTLSDEHGDFNRVPDIESDNGMLHPDIEQNFNTVTVKSKEKTKRLRPIYDWKTRNKSFIELHMDLKKLGVKNNKFFLILFDPDLQGVDPFSPILPLQTQVKIMAECIRNPWYFLREICRIPTDGSPIVPGGGSPFLIDRNSAASWYIALHNIDQYLSKPRQTGKTQCATSIINYAFHFGSQSSTIGFGNKDATNNKLNLYRLKCQRDMLPTYLQMRWSMDVSTGKIVKENNNVTTMKNPVTNNNIQLLPRAQSKDAAMTNGRGMTLGMIYLDEFDFIPYNTVTLGSSAPAYNTAHINALKNNCMTCRIFTSTPGDLDSRDGAAAKEFIDHMLVWKDEMFDWPIEKLEKAANDAKAKMNGIVYIEHTWKQLKKTRKWYEDLCKLLNYEQETIMREIDLIRMHGSSLSPFSREDIIYLNTRRKKDDENCYEKWDTGFNNATVYLYEKLKRNVPYIFGIDPSEGLGQDNNAWEIISPYTMEIVGEMKTPYISQTNFGKAIISFMDHYCPNAFIVIENNKGRELINYLLDSKYRDRLWYDTKKLMEATEMVKIHGSHTRDAFQRRAFGYNTNPSSRNLLFSTLETFMVENKNVFISDYVINDICGLVRTPTGKIEAGKGNHDDNIMAYLIGATVFRTADNLEEFGLSRGMSEKGMLGISEPDERSTLDKIRVLLPSLDSGMRSMFEDVMKAYDPLAESRQFHRDVQKGLQGQNAPQQSPNRAINEMVYSENAYDDFAMGILSSNDDLEQDSDNSFDVMDYI